MARLLVRLAPVEWTHAGRCFLRLMSLPNENSDRDDEGSRPAGGKISREQDAGLICSRHVALMRFTDLSAVEQVDQKAQRKKCLFVFFTP